MLGRIIIGLAAVAIGALAVTAIVKTVYGIIDRWRIKNLAASEGMKRVIIDSIDYCTNKVKITDLDTDRKMTIEGDDIDIDLDEYDIITIT